MTVKILKDSERISKQGESEGWSLPDTSTTEQLNELATKKLAEIVRRNSAGESLWQGYKPSEIAAARELLEQDAPQVAR